MKLIYKETRSVLADIRLEKCRANQSNKVISKIVLNGDEAMILFSELNPKEFEIINSYEVQPLQSIAKRLNGSEVYGIEIEVDCGRT